jgi:hypothetical protein
MLKTLSSTPTPSLLRDFAMTVIDCKMFMIQFSKRLGRRVCDRRRWRHADGDLELQCILEDASCLAANLRQ